MKNEIAEIDAQASNKANYSSEFGDRLDRAVERSEENKRLEEEAYDEKVAELDKKSAEFDKKNAEQKKKIASLI